MEFFFATYFLYLIFYVWHSFVCVSDMNEHINISLNTTVALVELF
jgi:hypothetical protein